ncbi:DHHC zinc finger domain-containing protein [Drechmeria coniospora]|uniref:Palmitoyltransferase n=1 Tax=Drechmeria coniospora TaxID=98403 RepID=A0A151GDB5_DRECN|nr:DHHC zinc finger domain-containing protein [Drechmeria coniospora]KYK55080.1 DHHC zinc finger domain-containing protein [Drechmeria coniospora]
MAMTPFKWAVVFVISLSFMVFVTFFGRLPAFRRTPVAGLHKLIWIHIPNAALALDNKLTAGKLSKSLSRGFHYFLYERHPTVVIFFLSILIVSEFLYLPEAWPVINTFTKLTAAIAVVLPYLFLYLACASDPGYITVENHAYHMSLYPYDHALFHPGNKCNTCHFLKPARSKHCSICKRCIAKADHHCVFINSCVGYGNHHWFLLLLLSTAVLTTYGGLLGLSLLLSGVNERYPAFSIWKPKDMSLNSYGAVWGWCIQRNVKLGATSLLSILITPLIWGLLIYTLYLVYAGTTTNESLKWSEYKEDMRDGYVFRRPLLSNRERSQETEPRCARWPVEPDHVLVATSDGCPPSDQARPQGDGEWERVWKLDRVENLYDMGFRDNLADAFLRDFAFGGRSIDPPAERMNRRSSFPPS